MLHRLAVGGVLYVAIPIADLVCLQNWFENAKKTQLPVKAFVSFGFWAETVGIAMSQPYHSRFGANNIRFWAWLSL